MDLDLEKLAKAAGRESPSGIVKWVRLGLLPPPRIVPGPSGRGRRGVWDRSVLTAVREIAALRRKGWSLEKIREQRRQAPIDPATTAKTSKDVATSLVRALPFRRLSREVFEKAARTEIGLSRQAAAAFARFLITPQHLEATINLRLQGFSPVAVWSMDDGKSEGQIIADFALSFLYASYLGVAEKVARGAKDESGVNRQLLPGGRLVWNIGSLFDPVLSRVPGVTLPPVRWLPAPSVLGLTDGSALQYPVQFGYANGAAIVNIHHDQPEPVTLKAVVGILAREARELERQARERERRGH
jgi:hypothetical protein